MHLYVNEADKRWYIELDKTTAYQNGRADGYDVDFAEGVDDYTAVDALIKRMNLTQGEYDVLCAYMSGLTYLEVAQLLNVNRTTIWCIRMRIQNKIMRCQ